MINHKTNGLKTKNYWNYLIENIGEYKELFVKNEDMDVSLKKKIFKKFVGMVILETSSYCNRACKYCPLSISQRGKRRRHMDKKVLHKILEDLKSINYDNSFCLNLYNEPLSDKYIFDVIGKIRQILPNAYIMFHSNGDYLKRETLDELVDVGNDALHVTLHADKDYLDEDLMRSFTRFFKRLSFDFTLDRIESGKAMVSKIYYKGMELKVMANNWTSFGSDRGGLLKDLHSDVRYKPCMRPFREIPISFEGNMFPCCNIFPDDNYYEELKSQNVKDIGIIDGYFSTIMTEFRKHLFIFGNKKGVCQYCRDEDNADVNTGRLRNNILSNCLA